MKKPHQLLSTYRLVVTFSFEAARSRLLQAVIAAVLVSTYAASATVLIQDDFSSDTQGGYASGWNYYSTPSTTNQWTVTADPTSASNNVMVTPGLLTRTTYQEFCLASSTGSVQGLELSFRFNASQAGSLWNTYLFFEAAPLSQAAYLANGYGITLSNTTARFYSSTGTGATLGTSAALGASNTTIALNSQWNSVDFKWLSDGTTSTLLLTLNGVQVASITDTTYLSPNMQSLKIVNFLNNLASPSPNGQVLLYDDFLVQTVPEPSSTSLLLLGSITMLLVGLQRRRFSTAP